MIGLLNLVFHTAKAVLIWVEALMKKKSPAFCLLFTVIFLLFGGRAWAAPVRIAYSIVGPPVAAVWMSQETGAFKKYGLDVQLTYIPSSGTNVQALLGGRPFNEILGTHR